MLTPTSGISLGLKNNEKQAQKMNIFYYEKEI